jgi:hypothetical protein
VDYADEESARLEAEEKFQAEQRKLAGNQAESAPAAAAPAATPAESNDAG